MKDGQPHMIMGSPGGDDQVMRTMQTLLNIVDFGHERPAGHRGAALVDREFPGLPLPAHDASGHLSVEARIPVAVQEALKTRGHTLTVSGPWSKGEMAVIRIDPKTGALHAGADPRVDAYAWAR